VRLLVYALVRLGAASTVFAASFGASTADVRYPTCHVHKSTDVHFRNAESKDVLEVSIGTGSCYAATLAIVIRSEFGAVLYGYVAPFKRHVVTNWADRGLDADATRFVEDVIATGMRTTSELPPYQDPTDFYDETNNVIQISKLEYEKLRSKRRPMLFHLTHYESWQYVVFDEATGKAVVVITGGL